MISGLRDLGLRVNGLGFRALLRFGPRAQVKSFDFKA